MKKIILLTLGAAAVYQVAKANGVTLEDVKDYLGDLKKYVMPTH